MRKTLPISWRVLVGIVLLFATSCNCRVVEKTNWADLYGRVQEDINNATIFEKRQSTDSGSCEYTECSPDACGGSGCSFPERRKRSLDGLYGDFNASDRSNSDELQRLDKRFLNNPRTAGTITSYLDAQSESPDIVRICPASPIRGYSFCVEQQFSSATLNTAGQYLAGSANTALVGCTVLTIVSSRAVYMCHFWEDIHYSSRPQKNPGRPRLGFQPCLNLIQGTAQTGAGSPGLIAGDALTPALYTQPYDNAWAFIMTPRARATPDDASSQRYGPQFNDLVALIRNLIPGIGVQEYNYYANAAADYQYPNGYQGVALFEYDQNADNMGNADWRLWLEEASERGRKLGQNPPRGNPN